MELIITDGGRWAAGKSGSCGDCVVRAIAIAAKRPYKVVYKECAEMNAYYLKTFFPDHPRAGVRTARKGVYTKHAQFLNYMKCMGFVWYPPRRQGKACKIYLDDADIPMGRVIVKLSRHWVAVVDGVMHDTGDPQRKYRMRWPRRRVYGWWKLEDSGTIQNAIHDIYKEDNHS